MWLTSWQGCRIGTGQYKVELSLYTHVILDISFLLFLPLVYEIPK